MLINNSWIVVFLLSAEASNIYLPRRFWCYRLRYFDCHDDNLSLYVTSIIVSPGIILREKMQDAFEDEYLSSSQLLHALNLVMSFKQRNLDFDAVCSKQCNRMCLIVDLGLAMFISDIGDRLYNFIRLKMLVCFKLASQFSRLMASALPFEHCQQFAAMSFEIDTS